MLWVVIFALVPSFPWGKTNGVRWVRDWIGCRFCLDVLEKREISWPFPGNWITILRIFIAQPRKYQEYFFLNLHNANQRNAHFSTFILIFFNFCCLLHASNLLCSSSWMYMPYGIFYMHRCETHHTAYTTVSLRMNPRDSKHVEDNRN